MERVTDAAGSEFEEVSPRRRHQVYGSLTVLWDWFRCLSGWKRPDLGRTKRHAQRSRHTGPAVSRGRFSIQHMTEPTTSQTASIGVGGLSRTRRGVRRWKWLRRGVVVMAAMLLLVALLPGLTSGRRLAALIERQVSDGAQVPLRIAEAEWGWWKGVVLKDIGVQLADRAVVRVKQVAIRANLWDLLVGRTVERVQVSDVTVDVVTPIGGGGPAKGAAPGRGPGSASEGTGGTSTACSESLTTPAGDWALADRGILGDASPNMTDWRESPGLGVARAVPADTSPVAPGVPAEHGVSKERVGALPVAIGQILLDRCTVNLLEAGSDRAVQVVLPATAVEVDRRSGVLNWRMSARVGQGLVASEGRFVLPRLAMQPADLRGSLQVAWTDLPLEELPRALLQRWQLVGLAGTVSGLLTVEIRHDWTLTYDASGSVRSLLAQPMAGEPVYVTQASAGMSGQWQIIDQQVRVQKAWAQLPGVELTAGEPALVYDGLTNHVVQSSLACRVADAEMLRGAVERLGVRLPKELRLAGQGGFDVHVGREDSATVVWLTMSGEQLAASWGDWYEHRTGQPLGLRATCRLWDDGSLELRNTRVDLPGGCVRVRAQLAAQPDEPGRMVVLKDSQVRVEWEDFQVFVGQVPLGRRIAALRQICGPGSAQMQAAVDGEAVRTAVSADLPAEARATVEGWLDKPVGRDLQLDVTGRLSGRYDWLDVDHVRLVSGGQVVADLQDLKVTAGHRVEGDRPVLVLDLQSVLTGLDVTGLGRLSPRVLDATRQVGLIDGQVRGRSTLTGWADVGKGAIRMLGLQGSGELNLDGLAVSVEKALHKKAGQKFRLAGAFRYERGERGQKGTGYGSAGIEAEGFAGQAWYEYSPQTPEAQQWAWGWLDIRDVTQAAAMLPAVQEFAKRECMAGNVAVQWEWVRHPQTFDLECTFDLTGIRCRPAGLAIDKAAGLPAKLALAVSGPAGDASGQQVRFWRLPKAEFVLGQSHAGIHDAEVEISEPWAKLLAGQGREAIYLLDFTWPIRRAAGKASGRTVCGEVLASVSRDMGTLLVKYRAAGPVVWTVDWRYAFGEGIDFEAQAEAAELSLRAEGFDKPAGVALQGRVKGKAEFLRDGRSQPVVLLNLSEAAGQASSLSWSGQVHAQVNLADGQPRLKTAQVSGKLNSPRVEELAGLFEPARPWRVRGHAAAEGSLAFAEQTGWKVEDLDVGFWPVEWSLEGIPCRLMGMVTLQGQRVQTTGLEARVGRTHGRFTIDTTLTGRVVSGQVGAVLASVDVDELRELGKRVGQFVGTATPPSAAPGASHGEATPPSTQRMGVAPNWQPLASQPLIDWAASKLEFMGSVDWLSVSLEAGQQPAVFNAIGWRGGVDGGALAVDLAGAFQGGPLAAEIRGHMVDKSIPLRIHYRVDRADSTELTRHMVAKSFPGMTVGDGPITLAETLTFDMSGQMQAPLSSGELIVEGGVVRGAAAPKFVTRLFPGLELASFRFSRMHNWYERDASGKTINRIIFRGSPWSMYMDGWSQLDGTMRYEIGVDLLGAAESEYWATANRGRIPLFIKTGQVVNGRLENEVVKFLNPRQVGERILKDNLLTITYHAIRQKVMGGRAGPSDRDVLSGTQQAQ